MKQPFLRLQYQLLLSTTALASTTNFCGNDWNSASTDCQNRQPCPGGIDDECDSGICWADTLCDTAKGDGILFDKDNPQHQRFCGNSWNDAAENCSPERHCASGDSSECKNGESCYSFLSGCNYVDMIAGSSGGGGGGKEDDGGPTRLDAFAPMRSNWCGSDWNDAIAHCTDDSHWCPSGSDSDCPDGKVCYAGTDCRYVADLHPTESPTPAPSISPTQSPLVYDTIENTRFCGSGWEDTQKNCQISRHCPQGKNSECPAGMTCYSWMSGCNILDMLDYLENYGVEIYGADRNEMNPSVINDEPASVDSTNINGAGDSSISTGSDTASSTGSDNNAAPSTGVRPSLSLDVWTPQPAPIIRTPPPVWTAKPAEPTTTTPTLPAEDGFHPEYHVFCGESWLDAEARCSEETFCSDGAVSHKCENTSEFCWVGITACNAADWLFPEETSAPTILTLAPVISTVAPTSAPSVPIDEETTAPIDDSITFPTFTPSILLDEISDAPVEPIISDSVTTTSDEPDRFSVRQSFCAENYLHLIQECAVLKTCNKSNCRKGHTCFKNVLCAKPSNPSPGSVAVETVETPAPIISETVTTPEPTTPLPSLSPVIATESPMLTKTPTLTPITLAPQTYEPTQQPSMFSLSESEVAQRMSNPNNYCAKNLQEILTSCSYALNTCNEGDPMCGLGLNCFGNVICPGPTDSPTNKPTTEPPVIVPVIITTLEPIAILVDDTTNKNPDAQSYCAESRDMVQSICATGFTCNEGPNTCPVGTACFSNVVCEALQNQIDTIEALPSSNSETTTISTLEASLESTEFAGNYCAESEDKLQSTCEDSIVCNDGYGTCPFGTFCFSNVVCKALQVQNDQSAPASELSSSDLLPMDECNDLCLKPINSGDCEYIFSLGITILPCTSISTSFEQATGIDQVCAGTGRCGTILDLNNCGTNDDLYMRVDVSICLEAGLGRSGVVMPVASQIVSTVANVAEPESTESQTGSTEAPLSPIVGPNQTNMPLESSETKPMDDPIVYPWEESSKNSTRENQAENQANSPVENQADIDSWWIMEESGASEQFLFLSFTLIGAMLLTLLNEYL